MFYTFLIEYKRQAALHSPALWLRLQSANLTLISSTENAESPIGPMDAQQVKRNNLCCYFLICMLFMLLFPYLYIIYAVISLFSLYLLTCLLKREALVIYYYDSILSS